MKTKEENLNYLNYYLNTDYNSLSDVNWGYISRHQNLSEEFIREMKDYVSWHYISRYQKLSEEFIREMKDKVSWSYISCYQKLSEPFIREFKKRVDRYYISIYQDVSEEFINENCKDFKYAWLKSWRRLTTEQKKKEIINTNLYECHDNHFIAYKAVRLDRSSWYAPERYTYLEGESYESNADYSSNENSFGLSVWTEKQANSFGNEYLNKKYLLLKIEVHYEDVARLVHGSHKIRCKRFKIID